MLMIHGQERYAEMTPYPIWTYGLKNDAMFPCGKYVVMMMV